MVACEYSWAGAHSPRTGRESVIVAVLRPVFLLPSGDAMKFVRCMDCGAEVAEDRAYRTETGRVLCEDACYPRWLRDQSRQTVYGKPGNLSAVGHKDKQRYAY